MRSHRSQRGMPVAPLPAPLPLPRARGDMESSDAARAFAGRAVLAFVAVYVIGLAGLVWWALS